MEKLPRSLIFILMLMFFNCSFWIGETIQCGGNQIAQTIMVDQHRKGKFRTVQAAIDSTKENNNRWVKVRINAGTYIEKVQISLYKPCIILEGAGKDITTIAFRGDRHSGLGATFVSSPPNVVVIGISFKNWYNLMGSEPIRPAPAAAIYGDRTVFYKCGFIGFQDTLFDAKGRHYFKECYIQGEVDFIYGGAQSYYEGCTINATQRKPLPGFITAHSRRSENDSSGFVFRKGSVKGNGQVNLGRAWGPYSRVIFHETYFSSVVTPQGWNAWNFGGKESQFTYAEAECSGPGADTTKRVQWEKKLTPSQLKEYSLESFINKDGWLSNLPVNLS